MRRQLFCRTVFVTTCVLPTLVAVLVSVGIHLPLYRQWRKAAWQQSLSQHLGLDVSIGSVQRAPGGAWIWKDVVCTNPETGVKVAVVDTVDVATVDGHPAIVLYQPILDQQQLQRVGGVVYDRVFRATAGDVPQVSVYAPELTLQGSAGAQTLFGFQLQWSGQPQRNQVLLEFRDRSQSDSKPIQVRVLRDRRQATPVTSVFVNTASRRIPVSLVADWFPPLRMLGPRSHFAGTVWMQEAAAGWNAELEGRWTAVDLHHAVTSTFPHKLSGDASLALRKLQIQDGRVTTATGYLQVGDGIVSRSLLSAAVAHLGLRLDEGEQPELQRLMKFREARIAFEMDRGGLTLTGHTDEGPADVLVEGAAGWQLRSSDAGPLPLVALVRTLVPESQVQVPATAETEWLIRRLPLPGVEPPLLRASGPPYTPLRLRR